MNRLIKYLSFTLLICLYGCSSNPDGKVSGNPYLEAKQVNTLQGYYAFLRTHNESEHAREIRELAEEIEWQNAIDINEIRAYGKFIFQHPNSENVSSATDLIKLIEYDHALHGSVHDKKEFSQKYPDDSLTHKLYEGHFEDLAEDPSHEAIQDHQEHFPDSPHLHKLEDFAIAIEVQHMIKRLKTNLNDKEHNISTKASRKIRLKGEFIKFEVSDEDFCNCKLSFRLEEEGIKSRPSERISTSEYSLHILDLDLVKLNSIGFEKEGISVTSASKYKKGFFQQKFKIGDDKELMRDGNYKEAIIPLADDERLKSQIKKDLLNLAKICQGT